MRLDHTKLQRLIKLSFLLLLFQTILLAQHNNYEVVKSSSTLEKIILNFKTTKLFDSTNILFDNGQLVNLPSNGCNGLDASIVDQNLGLNIYGIRAQRDLISIADDFYCYADWHIDSIKFFVFQTMASVPTINGVFVRIYDGDPIYGGNVIYGDLLTNVLARIGFTDIYRALNTTPTNCDRRLQEIIVNFNLDLSPGHYWIEYTFTGDTNLTGPWVPPITIDGVQTTGDAIYYTNGYWYYFSSGAYQQGIPFIIYGLSEDCNIQNAANPFPPDGATNISKYNVTLNWSNSQGTTLVDVYFGSNGDLFNVYSGATISQYSAPILDYNTNYVWKVVCRNDSCINSTSEIWHFKTEPDPTIQVDTVYPNFAQYWTGYSDGVTKNDGEVRGYGNEDGWMIFDLSMVPSEFQCVYSVTFGGYVNSTYWPYWSITPLPDLNPLIANASDIKASIEFNSGQWTAYLYQTESSNFSTGWKEYELGGNILSDIHDALVQGWIALGIDSRDNNQSFYINFDGWSQQNPPYLILEFCWIPVELTSFTFEVNDNSVVLNWTTATETNNQGFEIERRTLNSDWKKIGFVNGAGTTTEPHTYQFTELNLTPDNYLFRLKQIDFDGSFNYSKVIEANVNRSLSFSLTQNFPNPFNPITKIDYEVPQECLHSLKVFDVLGNVVANLISEYRSAGSYSIEFNASELSSGIYYYQLKAGDFVETKKMILMK